jgi:hypothetical protein
VDNVLRRSLIKEREKYLFECPGCGHPHYFTIPPWVWNKSWDYPTLSHTIIVDTPDRRCVFAMVDGCMCFDKSCHHQYAGRVVPMIPWD